MDVTPLIPAGRQIIQSYGSAGFKVSGIKYQGGLIVTPQKTYQWHDKTSIHDLDINDFNLLIESENIFDIFLFGTGAHTVFPDRDLLNQLKEHKIKPDIMDTGAASRTYNVLMAEDRRVAALLMSL